MDYRIFTDATADLTPEMLQGLAKVDIIPMQAPASLPCSSWGSNH